MIKELERYYEENSKLFSNNAIGHFFWNFLCAGEIQ
jgi:hypothetical protein